MTSDRLAEIHDCITSAVAEITSGDDWLSMLTVASRFHVYSSSNILLILHQRPNATRVAGYRAWQAFGRQVRRGERGIAILAPCTRTVRADDEEQRASTQVVTGFRVVHVFDVAQTDGEPLPDVRPVLLAGEDGSAMWDALSEQIEAAGFSIERGDCGSANGYTDAIGHRVRVSDRLAGCQAAKTLAHELAHVLLHTNETVPIRERARVEVEAESVAFVICTAAGLDVGDYSFPYVARWASGDLELIRDTADRVLACARMILGAGRLEVAPTG